MLTQPLPTCRSVSGNTIHLLRKGLLLSLCALARSVASWKITMLFSQTPLDARNRDSLMLIKVAGKNQSESSNGCPEQEVNPGDLSSRRSCFFRLPFLCLSISPSYSLFLFPAHLLFSLSCLSLSILLMHRFCSLRTWVSIMASLASPHIKAFLQQLSPLSYSLGIS